MTPTLNPMSGAPPAIQGAALPATGPAEGFQPGRATVGAVRRGPSTAVGNANKLMAPASNKAMRPVKGLSS